MKTFVDRVFKTTLSKSFHSSRMRLTQKLCGLIDDERASAARNVVAIQDNGERSDHAAHCKISMRTNNAPVSCIGASGPLGGMVYGLDGRTVRRARQCSDVCAAAGCEITSTSSVSFLLLSHTARIV